MCFIIVGLFAVLLLLFWGFVSPSGFEGDELNEGDDDTPDLPNLSTVAKKKLTFLGERGYVVNGVSIIHAISGKRGFIDNLGFVGWY